MSEPIRNDQLALICGESGTGKSASLRNIEDQPSWFYANAEAGKRLPFKSGFQELKLEDPYQAYELFDVGKDDPNCKGAIVDTITFLMDMLETQYVIPATNTQKAWGDFAQFFKVLMQQKVVAFNKPTLFLAHTRSDLDETAMEMKTSVPVKGSLKNNGIEAYFSTVVSTKKVALKDLKDYENDLLNITEDDEIVGFKHVFQTRLTKKTIGERIRSPMGMFSRNETYIDNDAQLLLNRLNEFYGS